MIFHLLSETPVTPDLAAGAAGNVSSIHPTIPPKTSAEKKNATKDTPNKSEGSYI